MPSSYLHLPCQFPWSSFHAGRLVRGSQATPHWSQHSATYAPAWAPGIFPLPCIQHFMNTTWPFRRFWEPSITLLGHVKATRCDAKISGALRNSDQVSAACPSKLHGELPLNPFLELEGEADLSHRLPLTGLNLLGLGTFGRWNAHPIEEAI